MKALIVEDELVSRRKMHKILNEFAICDTVMTCGEALDAFQAAWEMKAPYDIIMLDIELADASGMDVLFEIRQKEVMMRLPKTKTVRIIMATGNSDKGIVAQCISAGCNGYILKPFNRESVQEKLKQVFSSWMDD